MEWASRTSWARSRCYYRVPLCCNCAHTSPRAGVMIVLSTRHVSWKDPEARKTKLAAELANGRLAMMAIIGRLA